MSTFNPNLVTMSLKMHINCGKAANKCMYDVHYDGDKIGEAVRGREGKTGIFKIYIGDKELCMNTQREQCIEAIKGCLNA